MKNKIILEIEPNDLKAIIEELEPSVQAENDSSEQGYWKARVDYLRERLMRYKYKVDERRIRCKDKMYRLKKERKSKPAVKCCKIGCNKDAKVVICYGNAPTDCTESCSEHIADLLTEAKEHRLYQIDKEAE